MMDELIAPFQRLLADIFTPQAIRAVERGEGVETLWDQVKASGYLDALVPEAQGGAGLSLAEVQPLWVALGAVAAPLPVGETMIARYLLARDGQRLPDQRVVLATGGSGWPICYSDVAERWLYDDGGKLRIVDAPAAQADAAGDGDMRRLAAVLRASLIAGGAARLTEMTTDYANARVQFGKPIGRQQALQQNMAQMAEDMVACRIAAQLACAGSCPPNLAAVATAKSVTSSAVARLAATAHAVHGAIGISAEYDLQLITGRLHAWRWADGAETYWNRLLGAERLAFAEGSVDYARLINSSEIGVI